MNFSETDFWLSLMLGLSLIGIIRILIKKSRFDRLFLACLSLLLLALESLLTLGVFLFVFSVTYLALRRVTGDVSKGFIPSISLLQLTPLIFYKYAPFFFGELSQGQSPEFLKNLVIPVGLSFYTFQMVGLVIDTVKGSEKMPGFLDSLNFASFFPQIVAGPIERRKDLLPQIETFHFTLHWDLIEHGIRWIILGLFMKLTLAENIAAESSVVEIDPANPFPVWLEALFFTFRIYFDFAGYSLIAFGLAKCLGIEVTLNFCCPYWTNNFRDFWRHWHVSLSRWFRDYLYIPLGGNRSPWKPALIVLVFITSGIWHGAGWNFIIWGILHGILVLLPSLSKFRVPRWIAWPIHMVLLVFTWLFFFERDPCLLYQKVTTLMNPFCYTGIHLQEITAAFPSKSAFIASAGILALSALTILMEGIALKKPYILLTHRLSCLIMILMIYLLKPASHHDFIYFNF